MKKLRQHSGQLGSNIAPALTRLPRNTARLLIWLYRPIIAGVLRARRIDQHAFRQRGNRNRPIQKDLANRVAHRRASRLARHGDVVPFSLQSLGETEEQRALPAALDPLNYNKHARENTSKESLDMDGWGLHERGVATFSGQPWMAASRLRQPEKAREQERHMEVPRRASERWNLYNASLREDSHDGVRYFFSTGEPSGESMAVLLAEEIRKLDGKAEFEGIGGKAMRAAGFRLWRDHTGWASMGPAAAIPRGRQQWGKF